MRINATYYGWRFAAYLAAIFTVSAIGAGIIMHALFWLLGLIPEPKAGSVQQLAQFRIDYVFFLNIAAIAVTAALLWQWWQDRRHSIEDGTRAREKTGGAR